MRLIDAKALIEKIHNIPVTADKFSFEHLVMTYAPTIDAEPVRHGHWIEKTDYNLDTYYTCSSCGEDFCTIDGTPKDNGWNYCPNCGAKMDEVVTSE